MPLSRPLPVAGYRTTEHLVALKFQGTSSIVVRGPVTGISYSFSPTEPVRNIHARDAAVLLRTGSFRLI